MESVWRVLKSHPPVMPRTTIDQHLLASWNGPDAKAQQARAHWANVQCTDHEAALALFFCYAYVPMVVPFTAGIDRSKEISNICRDEAAKLHTVAEFLREQPGVIPIDDRHIDHAANVEAAAAALDRGADRWAAIKPSPLLTVTREQPHRRARQYVNILAKGTRQLFGTLLYGTLATVTSVALSEKIKGEQVRNWCRADLGDA
jgi:hypothetical protein